MNKNTGTELGACNDLFEYDVRLLLPVSRSSFLLLMLKNNIHEACLRCRVTRAT